MENTNKTDLKKGFFDSLFKSFPDLVFLIDSKGIILKASNSVLEHGADSKEVIIDRSIFHFFKPNKIPIIKRDFKNLLETGKLKKKEYQIRKMNNTFYSAELSATTMELSKEKYIIVIIRDISEKKEIRNELENKQEIFQLVIDNIPQHIYWKNKNSVYIGCNENFARVAGVKSPEDIIGKTDYDLAWKKSEADSFYEIDHLVMELDKPEYHVIEPQKQADGNQAWRDTNRIPLHDSDNNVIGVLGTYEDITERIEAKKALRDSKKKYEKAFNRAEFYKDIFAHDISNILHNILSSIEICNIYLNHGNNKKEIRNILNLVDNQITRGNLLVENIKKLSTIEKNNNIIESLNLYELIDNVSERVLTQHSDKEIEIKYNNLKNKNYKVNVNRFLDDAIFNILKNSVEYNKSEIIQIQIRVNKTFRYEREYIKLEIIDNGIGIPDKQKEVILENLRKESQISNRIGLGLIFVEKILSLSGGEFIIKDRVDGNHKKGTNFILFLPN